MWVKKAKGKSKAIIDIPMVTIILAVLVMMVPMGSAESEVVNETAFWAFVTIAVTVVVSVIITGIFHYLSTRELRKMKMVVAVGKMGYKVHEDIDEDFR